MRLQVLRPFPFADDGIKAEVLEAGREFDCPDDIAPGLIRGKLARPAGLEDEQPFGEPAQDDGAAAEEVGEADEASNDAGEDGDDQDDEDEDGEADEKEDREPIENKDAGDPKGSTRGRRGRRTRKGA